MNVDLTRSLGASPDLASHRIMKFTPFRHDRHNSPLPCPLYRKKRVVIEVVKRKGVMRRIVSGEVVEVHDRNSTRAVVAAALSSARRNRDRRRCEAMYNVDYLAFLRAKRISRHNLFA